MSTHDELVQGRFGTQAAAYLSSATHAQGPEFALLQESLGGLTQPNVLDLGCGAGHVTYHVAPLAGEVVACDPSPQMLAVVAKTAVARELGNVRTAQGQAEALPFADASFDRVFSRYSAHHWGDLGQGLREARRVLCPGGEAIFIDVTAPENPLLDTHLQTMELLRDPGHVRDYTPGEWVRQCGEAGLAVMGFSMQRLRLAFEDWVARMATPQILRDAIRLLQAQVATEVHHHFAIEADGSFTVDVILLHTRR